MVQGYGEDFEGEPHSRKGKKGGGKVSAYYVYLALFLIGLIAGAYIMKEYIQPYVFEPVAQKELNVCQSAKSILDVQNQNLTSELEQCTVNTPIDTNVEIVQ